MVVMVMVGWKGGGGDGGLVVLAEATATVSNIQPPPATSI